MINTEKITLIDKFMKDRFFIKLLISDEKTDEISKSTTGDLFIDKDDQPHYKIEHKGFHIINNQLPDNSFFTLFQIVSGNNKIVGTIQRNRIQINQELKYKDYELINKVFNGLWKEIKCFANKQNTNIKPQDIINICEFIKQNSKQGDIESLNDMLSDSIDNVGITDYANIEVDDYIKYIIVNEYENNKIRIVGEKLLDEEQIISISIDLNDDVNIIANKYDDVWLIDKVSNNKTDDKYISIGINNINQLIEKIKITRL